MMGKIKMMCTAVAVLAIGSAFASGVNATLVKFSSKGDKYADGAKVLDGEWYALCWSANETFGGVDSSCKPIVEGDEVIRAHSLAKDGGCPGIVFVLSDAEAKDSGYYYVCMLDTRTSAVAVAGDADNDGMPDIVNYGTVALTTGMDTEGVTVGEAGQTAVAESSDVATTASATPAKITAIDPSGDEVLITVANMNPLLRYDIKYGSTVTGLSTSTLTVGPKSGLYGMGEVQFSVSKENANFFQVIPANN